RGPARPPPLPTAPPPLCRGEEEEAPLQRPAVHVRHFQPASAAGASGGRGRAGGAGSEPAASSAPLREGLRAPLQSWAHGRDAAAAGLLWGWRPSPRCDESAFPAGTVGKPLGGATRLGCRGRPVVAGQVATLRVARGPGSELPRCPCGVWACRRGHPAGTYSFIWLQKASASKEGEQRWDGFKQYLEKLQFLQGQYNAE
ncbi:hypothetical protein DV515_00010668, partial [Chloebia gouldiae]